MSTNQLIVFITYIIKIKLVSNLTQTFVCAANSLRFSSNWRNLLVVSLFTDNGGVCVIKPGLITKKEEPSKICLYFLSHIIQLLSFFLSSTLFKMLAAMSNWQISSILASFLLLANNSPARLTS